MIVGVAVVGIAIGVFVFLYGGENFSNNPPPVPIENLAAVEVPFTELASGTQSNIKKRTNYLITSIYGLEELWKLVDTKRKMPDIDFNKNYVIAVFAGQNPTSGYAISVSKVEDAQNRVVTITLISPGTSCVLAQSKTAPYQIIELSKTSLLFTHEDKATVSECK